MAGHDPQSGGRKPTQVPEETLAGQETSSARETAAFQEVDHYQLQEVIGQGGMGVVFRALDTRLQRRVAIKVLKPGREAKQGSQGYRRFVTEARITGQLQHPGIPPVHELGVLSDGRPFLAMKLVQGETLRELLRRRSAPSEDLARFVAIFEQVCHAVGYAHSQGIIHRDLKPANVMVGSHGEVQVMDWGLAKVFQGGSSELFPPGDGDPLVENLTASQEDSAEAGMPEHLQPTITHLPGSAETPERGDSATRTGQTLGTPAYMAPEQAGGEIHALDARCDVFGLGAILCEILTGSPPYTGEDMHQVLFKAYRAELDDAFERLEACSAEPELVELCRRCLAPNKQDRPQDGNQVAQAVERIRQRAEQRAREAELEKTEALVREAEQRKRRRQLFWAAAVVVLVLLVGVIGTTLGMLQAQRNRRQAEAALAAERQARRQAMAALRFMTDDAIRDEMASGGRLPTSRRRYLEKVLEYYEGFARVRGEREEARAIRAEGLHRVAELQFYLGENRQALEHLNRAAELYRQLVRDHPQKALYQVRLVNVLDRLSWMLSQGAGRFAQAEKLAQETLQVATQLVRKFPEEPKYQESIASAHNTLALVYHNTNRYAEAQRHYQQAIQYRQQLVQKFPKVPEYRNNLASSHNNLGNAYRSTRQYAEAQHHYQQAIQLWQGLVQEAPDVPLYRNLLAASRNNLGNVYQQTRRYAQAQQQFLKAIELKETLAQLFPQAPQYQSSLANSHNNLGNVYRSMGRYPEAERHYREALHLREKLAEQYPQVPEYRSSLAGSHNNLGMVYRSTRRHEEAERHYRQAIQLREELIRKFPDVPEYLFNLSGNHNNLGNLYLETRRYPEAEQHYQQAVKLLKGLVQQFPGVQQYQNALASGYSNLGNVLLRLGRPEEAEQQFHAALRLREELAARFPLQETLQKALASSHYELAKLYFATGRFPQAHKHYQQAIQLREAMVQRSPERIDLHQELASTRFFWSMMCRRAGREQEAAQELQQATRHWLAAAERLDTRKMRLLRVSLNRVCRRLIEEKKYQQLRQLTQQALDASQRLLARSPQKPEYQTLRQTALFFHGVACAGLLQEKETMNVARQIAQSPGDRADQLYHAACVLALAAQVSSSHEQLDEQAQDKLAEKYADRAMVYLRQAIQQGYANLRMLERDPALDALRQRKDFQALLAQLEAKSPAEEKQRQKN